MSLTLDIRGHAEPAAKSLPTCIGVLQPARDLPALALPNLMLYALQTRPTDAKRETTPLARRINKAEITASLQRRLKQRSLYETNQWDKT